MQTFGAIYIGTYEMSLKVYEVSTKKQYKEVDFVRVRLDLQKDIQKYDKVSDRTMDVISEGLTGFKEVMDGYGVTDYVVNISPALKFASNKIFLIEQIYNRTGMRLKALSNSEQKYLDLLAITDSDQYEDFANEGIIIVDVGGNSLQLTLVHEGEMITTQHVFVSSVKIRENLRHLDMATESPEKLVEAVVGKEINAFRQLFNEYGKIKHLLIIGDYISDAITKAEKKNNNNKTFARENFLAAMDKIIRARRKRISAEENGYQNSDSLAESFINIYYGLVKNIVTEDVTVVGTTTHEGIFLNYCYENKVLKKKHDFEDDIRTQCLHMAMRYRNDPVHDEAINMVAREIFDATKKLHGLNKRDKLLLEVSVMLHDCGRFVSLEERAQSAHDVILASEIIGLSHEERKIVANVAKYNREDLPSYEDMTGMSLEGYLKVAKLAAIVKLAAALDSTSNQSVKSVSCSVKGDNLAVAVDTVSDITIEKIDFEDRKELFEEVFNLKPVIKENRIVG